MVTVILPVVAPAGTTNVRLVLLNKLYDEILTPFSLPPVRFTKLVPVTVTVVPTGPEAGVNEVMVGIPSETINEVVLCAMVPPKTATENKPEVAPLGITTVRVLSLRRVYWVINTLPMATAVMLVKPEPLMVTVVPVGPVAGLNELIAKLVLVTTNELKLEALYRPMVMLMLPVVALVGTVAVITESLRVV